MTITETFEDLLYQYDTGNSKKAFFDQFQQMQDGDRHAFLMWLRDEGRADALCSLAVRLI